MPNRPVRLPLYVLTVLAVMATLGPIGSVVASTAISGAKARESLTQTQLEQCGYIGAQIAVYEETPPTTATGAKLLESYRYYYTVKLRCDEKGRAR